LEEALPLFSDENNKSNGARGGVVGWGTMLQAWNRKFESRWSHWIFQMTQSFQPHYGPGVGSAANRNKYQESSGRPERKADNFTASCEQIV
jgi:hypothetical protein